VKKFIKKILSVICTISLGACSSASSFLANYPVDDSELTISKDVAYGDKEVQKLDIYKAKNIASPAPVIIFFYGGGYSDGSKNTYLFLADHFAKQGYIVVIPDYSKYPQVKFPAFVEDSAKAVAWTKAHISEYGGQSDSAILMGHSAGAHIAALLNYDEKYLQAAGVESSYIKAIIGLAGPYSFTPEGEKYKIIFGPAENYKNMKVDNFVDGNEAPALLLWGADDVVVGKQNIEILEAKIKQKQGKVESIIFPDVGHISIISAYTKVLNNKKVTKIVDDYLAGLKN